MSYIRLYIFETTKALTPPKGGVFYLPYYVYKF